MVGRGSSKLELHKLREIDIARAGGNRCLRGREGGDRRNLGPRCTSTSTSHSACFSSLGNKNPGRRKACLKELYEEPLILNSFGNRATPRVGTISAQIAQGMSIDHLEVDLSNAFEPGQPYVALRCVYLIGFFREVRIE